MYVVQHQQTFLQNCWTRDGVDLAFHQFPVQTQKNAVKSIDLQPTNHTVDFALSKFTKND